MDGKLYRLERTGYRRGLELHMDLLDSTKQELMQDIIRDGVFETSVLSGVEEELLNERQAFAILQLRHEKQKELTKHELDFAHSAFSNGVTERNSLAATHHAFDRATNQVRRVRSDTVARHRGVRTKFGHRENDGFNVSCPAEAQTLNPKDSPRARSSSLGTKPLENEQMRHLEPLKRTSDEWGQNRVIDEDQAAALDRVFSGNARVHPAGVLPRAVYDSHSSGFRQRASAGAHPQGQHINNWNASQTLEDCVPDNYVEFEDSNISESLPPCEKFSVEM